MTQQALRAAGTRESIDADIPQRMISMEQLGSQLGYYRLYERIGGGGFAMVYVARDTRTNEVVAVKVLRTQYGEDQRFISRFQREASVLQSLPENPHIVRVREVGQQGSTHYLVMEYLEGQDLSLKIAEKTRLPVDEALSIAHQVAQALDVANQHGLVHRDIKPQNIKVTPQGVAKVMDFGIARAAEQTQLTQSGTLMGTPDYMAPEIWEGKKADIRSDIYALGIILYEMLTGLAPFHGDTPAVVMHGHLMRRPRPIRSVRSDVPPSIDAMIAKMVAKKPEDRYQTPADVMAALTVEQEARKHVTPLPKPATGFAPKPAATPIPKPVSKRARREQAIFIPLGFAGLGALVLVAAVILFATMGNSSSNGKPTATTIALTAKTEAPAQVLPTAASTIEPASTATSAAVVPSIPSPVKTVAPSPAVTPTRPSTDTPAPTKIAMRYGPIALREPKSEQSVGGGTVTFEFGEISLQAGDHFEIWLKRVGSPTWDFKCTQIAAGKCTLSLSTVQGYGEFIWTTVVVDGQGQAVSEKGEERKLRWCGQYGCGASLPPDLNGESPVVAAVTDPSLFSIALSTLLSLLAGGGLLGLILIGERKSIAQRLRDLAFQSRVILTTLLSNFM
ncbi:MAG: protein kinase [Chloroflexota bacterium]|nr:protein kinase [Chloroflexota bacterium]